jgi:23S rRNA-/tRNA-specific pseudouridylate synthase
MMIQTTGEGMGDWRSFVRSPLLTGRPLDIRVHFQEKGFRIASLRINEVRVDLNAKALALRLTSSRVSALLVQLKAPPKP